MSNPSPMMWLEEFPVFIATLVPTGPISGATKYRIRVSLDGMEVPGVFDGEFTEADAGRALVCERYFYDVETGRRRRRDFSPIGPPFAQAGDGVEDAA
jgi:hypothetical protein